MLSKNIAVKGGFFARHGDRFVRVRDYYAFRRDAVTIQDVSPFVPELVAAVREAAEDEEE